VPADPLESLGRELAPIFEQLEPVWTECRSIISEAVLAAQRGGEEAARQARDVVDRARIDADAQRLAAAVAARATAADAAARIMAQARARAQGTHRWNEQHRSRVLARALDLVRADLGALTEGGAIQGAGS
jgi:hypothetical protein